MSSLFKHDTRCNHKNGLVERPAEFQTYEQRWCGTWFDCPYCHFSRLAPSDELTAFLGEQRLRHNLSQPQPALFTEVMP